MSVTAAQGFRAAGVRAGLKASGKPDLALVVNDGPLDTAAGVFTTNRVVAAPVVWSRQLLAGEEGGQPGRARAVVLNSGSANACTGTQGMHDTEATAARTAGLLGAEPGQILVCSTGVIGERIDMPVLLEGVDVAALALADYTWNTGDTTPLHDISAPECQWCAQTTTDTTTTYTTGGWAANAWHTNTNPTTTTPNTTTTNTYTTTLTTTQRTPDIYQPGHFQRFTYIEKATFEITVRWDGNRWLISEVVPTPTTPRPDWLPPVAQTPAPTSQPPTTTPPSQPPAPTPPAPQAPDGTPSNGSAPSQSTGPDTTAPGTTGSPSTDRSADEEEPTGAPEPTNPADAYAR